MCRLLLMTIACLLIMFGISGLVFMPRLIQQKIEQRLHLKIGTKTFERFTRVPIPLTVKFYLFNVTNSDRVLLGLERPKFKEIGPFMYKQWRRREIVDFEDYNRRLRYREYKTFYPMFSSAAATTSPIVSTKPLANVHQIISNDTSESPIANQGVAADQVRHISVNDTMQVANQFLNPHDFDVTIVNLPLLSALTKLAQLEAGSLKRYVASTALSRLLAESKDKILITRKANELLFDGYKVRFMESARDLVSDTLSFNFVSPLPKNIFGFFHNKNNTWSRRESGELTVFTGRNDSMKDFMMVDNWNDQKQLHVWPNNTIAGNRCNEIRGTDGSQFHPGATRDQTLSIFSPMICTSIKVVFKEDTETRGIPLLRFTTPPDIFAAPKKHPRNACYCTVPQRPMDSPAHLTATATTKPQINDSRCYLDGLMDLSLCQRGAPVAASSPHFYNADPMLAMAAGLRPQKEIHETFLDIEPMTGAVFRAASRAQLNAYVEQAALDVIDSSIIGNMTAMVAPLLWLEELGEIDEKSSNEFKGQLLNLVHKARRSFYYAISIGCLIIILVCAQYYYAFCYNIRSPSSRMAKTGSGRRDDRDQRKPGVALAVRNRRSADQRPGRQRAANLVVGAAVLGAASASGNGKRRAQRQKAFDEDDGCMADEEQMSKRMLVPSEWEDGGEGSRAGSSSPPSALSQESDKGQNTTLLPSEANVADESELVQEEDVDDYCDDLRPGTSSL